jgi:hypothetical protein
MGLTFKSPSPGAANNTADGFTGWSLRLSLVPVISTSITSTMMAWTTGSQIFAIWMQPTTSEKPSDTAPTAELVYSV